MNSPESFVPLTAASAPTATREFRVAIINGHDHALPASTPVKTGFQSLEAQRQQVAIATNGTDGAAEAHAANGAVKKMGEPHVLVQRDGDRVTHLRIQCTCGMIMDLACVYDTPKAA